MTMWCIAIQRANLDVSDLGGHLVVNLIAIAVVKLVWNVFLFLRAGRGRVAADAHHILLDLRRFCRAYVVDARE